MTKVNLTVTKDLEDVPQEVSKMISESIEQVSSVLDRLQKISGGLSLGLSMSVVSEQMEKELANLESISLLYRDMQNICSSMATIEASRKESLDAETVKEKVREQVSTFKFDAEAKIGQFSANEKIYKSTIESLQGRVKELENNSSKTTNSTKTTKKKSTSKK